MRGVGGTLHKHIWQPDGRSDAPRRFRKPCAYEAFRPAPLAELSLDLPAGLAADIEEAHCALRDLDRAGGSDLDAFARLLLRSEAVASSKIEGMQVGVRELARAEAKFDLGASIGAESLSVLRAVEAMQHAVDSIDDAGAVTPNFLQEVHRLLTQSEAPWVTPGVFRVVQNWIGGNNYNPCGAAFVPPEPEFVDSLLADLCAFLGDDSMPSLVQAAIAHAQFETIHPFNDGNGRVGRALIHTIFRARGTAGRFVAPISLEFGRRKDQYIAGLESFREGHVLEWIEYFAVSTVRAVYVAERYLSSVRDLQDCWREQLAALPTPPRSDSVAWRILDVLPSQLVLTGSGAVAATGGAKPRVNLAIDQLVTAGILEPLSSGARNRSWEPVGLLDLVDAVERGE